MPKSPRLEEVSPAELQGALLAWYAACRRPFPWRDSTDPYAVWVSEMMLQQTQAAAVVPYFLRWMERFPALHVLAAASEEEVLAAWQGLGYYRRVRMLHSGARRLAEENEGRIPASVERLRELPGVGPYTAGAIASIAFNLPEPAVDGNIIRVLCRLFAERGDPARQPLQGRLWEIAAKLAPPEAPGDWNQALMELGSTLCLPRSPRCGSCPVAGYCRARELGIEADLPETAARPALEAQTVELALLQREEAVLLVRRSSLAPRWGGFWSLPAADTVEGEPPGAAAEQALAALGHPSRAVEPAGQTVHGVTRYRVTSRLWLCRPQPGAAAARPLDPGWGTPLSVVTEQRWTGLADLSAIPLPAAQRRLLSTWKP